MNHGDEEEIERRLNEFLSQPGRMEMIHRSTLEANAYVLDLPEDEIVKYTRENVGLLGGFSTIIAKVFHDQNLSAMERATVVNHVLIATYKLGRTYSRDKIVSGMIDGIDLDGRPE